MKRGALRPARTGNELQFGDYLIKPDLSPAVDVYHNPLGAVQSQGYLLNDTLADCVIVSAARYRQRQIPTFTPTDDIVAAAFAQFGSPPTGLDPFAVMQTWATTGITGLGKIAAWVEVDLSDATECIQAIKLTLGLISCFALADDAEQSFPAPWLKFSVGGDGHCTLEDGWDQKNPNALFDRCTWAREDQGGVNLEFMAACGFAGMAVIPAEWLQPGGAPPGIDQAKLLDDLNQIGQLAKE